MDDRKLLFGVAFTINMLAFGITIYLFEEGAIEGNPIMDKMFSYGVFTALLFSIFIWILLYIVLIHLPENVERDKHVWIKASRYACALLVVLTMIDFLNDYIWLIISL